MPADPDKAIVVGGGSGAPVAQSLKNIERCLLATPHRLRTANELLLQDYVEEVLRACSVSYEREYRGVGKRDRPDFFLPDIGWALEVKLRYPVHQAMRQVARYLEHDVIRGVAIASARRCSIPPIINGKPVYEFPLWKVYFL